MKAGARVWIQRGVLWLLAALLLTAGVLKAWDPATFANDVFHYRILPWSLSVAAALYLPYLEIVLSIAMVLPRWRHTALLLWSGLILVFIGALISAKIRGLSIACGCFGSADAGAGIMTALVRDGTILGALVWLLWRERKP